jgi:hypothetical protein
MSDTSQPGRRAYLPRGITQKLADHFFITPSAVRYRIRRGHVETINMAMKLATENAKLKYRKRAETQAVMVSRLDDHIRALHQLEVATAPHKIAREPETLPLFADTDA